MKRKRTIIVIRKSCLTGRVVWVYKGPTKGAARSAYCRACKREVDRVRHWGETTAQRRAGIMRLLNECIDAMPITSDMTPKQKAAVRQLINLSKEDIACHREFYEHILEERRRRAEDAVIRRQMREREKLTNRDYV